MELSIFGTEKTASIVEAAKLLSKSSIIPQSLQGKPENVFAILCTAIELKIGPMQAINLLDVIQGRVAMRGQLMLALVRKNFPDAYIDISVDEKNLVARCEVARSIKEKETAYLATWDMNKAQMMGLTVRDQYKKQPLTMLRWRAVAEALRVVFPDALCGLYAREELTDLDGAPLKNIVPAEVENGIDPRTPEQKEEGNPRFLICFGKFRNKELCQIDPKELEDYLDVLEKRFDNGPLKDWEAEVRRSALRYLESLDKGGGDEE